MSLFESVLQISLIAISYYLFSKNFFDFSSQLTKKTYKFRTHVCMFSVVFAWFFIASIFELPLILNWLVFLIILGWETHYVFHADVLISYALSMFCIIMSLSVNILFRCLVSIIINIPLNNFDETLSAFKGYPIMLGFFAMVLFLAIIKRSHFAVDLKRMLENRNSLSFFAVTELLIYLFLVYQLSLYGQSDNLLETKLWGIKSAVFSVVVLIITCIYASNVANLYFYIDKQHIINGKLITQKKDINSLWRLAYTDVLTGCSNRQLLDRRLKEYANYGGEVTLAFLDVNDLKLINDKHGHLEGDHYLFSIVNVINKMIDSRNIDLYRYGGDEFILMSDALTIEEIEQCIININEELKRYYSQDYIQSISYGVVHGKSSDYKELIEQADNKMYQYKKQYHHNTRDYT